MYGAILGDIIGSRFEFNRGGKTKDFELLTIEDNYTDDTVMTVAVGEALLNAGADASVDKIEAAINKYYEDGSKDNLVGVLEAIRERMHADGHFIHPVLVNEESKNEFAFRSITTKDGKAWSVAFTSDAEIGEYGKQFSKVQRHFLEAMVLARNNEKHVKGIMINAFSEPFEIPVHPVLASYPMRPASRHLHPDERSQKKSRCRIKIRRVLYIFPYILRPEASGPEG